MRIITAHSSNFKAVGNIEVVKVFEPEELESYRIQQENDFPHNRGMYCTAQGGEFTDWIEAEPDDIICFCDSDIIQQRRFTEDEFVGLTPKKGEFIANYNSYPPLLIDETSGNLLPTKHRIVPPLKEFQAGVLIARYADWVSLKGIYIQHYEYYCKGFKHHAMTQLLINYLVQAYFKLRIAPDWLHNGYWLTGTKAHKKDGKMWTDREVIFNHYKGVEDYK